MPVGWDVRGHGQEQHLLGFELNCHQDRAGLAYTPPMRYGPLSCECVRPGRPSEVTRLSADGTSTAEKANWRAQTPVKMRFRWIGCGSYGWHPVRLQDTLMIDVAGKWQKFETKLGEQSGNDIVTGTFLPRFNSTANLFAVITCVNAFRRIVMGNHEARISKAAIKRSSG